MFSIINHQGNANQNHKEIQLHSSYNDYHQKEKKGKTNVGKDVCGEKGTVTHY